MAVSLKYADKCLRILVPKPVADLRNSKLGMQKEIFPLLQSDGGEKLGKGKYLKNQFFQAIQRIFLS